jgi:uncharacterized OB-fold protein
MFCPHCGSNTLDAQGICQACGQETIESPDEMETKITGAAGNCLNCGAPLEPDELFCGQCGARAGAKLSSEAPLKGEVKIWGTSPRRVRGYTAPSSPIAQDFYQDDRLSDEYDAPTEAYRRAQPERSTLRTSPTGGYQGRDGMSLPISSSRLMSGKPYVQPDPRPRVALVIGLLCFLASFISGGAAIWLAIASLH